MKIKMTLLSDAIPGNGESVPGGEDISVLHDEQGFPYYKGGTLKGIFREELINHYAWTGASETDISAQTSRLLGSGGDDSDLPGKLRFSDLVLSEKVRQIIMKEQIGGKALSSDDILGALSYMRTFTAIDEGGMVKEGSLRYARCLKKGLIFYGEIRCASADEGLVREVLSQIKWIGTMRNRGFGRVRIEAI